MNVNLSPTAAPSCTESNYALLWPLQTTVVLYLPAVQVEWAGQEGQGDLLLALQPEDLNDEALLESFRPGLEPVVVAHRFRIGLCKLIENKFVQVAGTRNVRLRLTVFESDFTPALEMSLGSISADKLAELRARRLLLNENAAVESTDINEVMRELFLRGHDTRVQIERSPFPSLFQTFGKDPQKFLGIAWILALAQLRLSGCVSEITRLQLTLRGSLLDVVFDGRRKQKYREQPGYEIRVSGSCPLS